MSLSSLIDRSMRQSHLPPTKIGLWYRRGVTLTRRGFPPSVRFLVQLLHNRGYSLLVLLFPHNTFDRIPAANLPFAVVIWEAILMCCPPLPSVSTDDESGLSGALAHATDLEHGTSASSFPQ